MNNPKLTFNVLTFKHPAEEYTFHFSNEEIENSYRAHKSLVPAEVIEHFGEQEHYTQYTTNDSGLLAVTKKSKPVYIAGATEDAKPIKECNSSFSNSLIKRFYIRQINNYFESIGVIVKPNFIDDLELWLPLNEANQVYNIYEKYALKIQFAIVSQQP